MTAEAVKDVKAWKAVKRVLFLKWAVKAAKVVCYIYP